MTHTRFTPSSLLSKLLAVATMAVAFIGTSAQAADPRVGVSVNIGQPGFYGRIDIGDRPAPAIIYPQPIIIQQTPVAVYRRPIYMRVPQGHSHNWARYCGRYSACGQPVYFVRDGGGYGGDRDDRRNDRHDRDYDRHDRHDRHDHHDRGRGHDKHDHGRR
jgi:hypothetical protein